MHICLIYSVCTWVCCSSFRLFFSFFSSSFSVPFSFLQKVLQYFWLTFKTVRGILLLCGSHHRRWWVVYAACCHMALVFTIVYLYHCCLFVSWCTRKLLTFLIYNLKKSCIDQSDLSSGLMVCILRRATLNLKGLNWKKLCLMTISFSSFVLKSFHISDIRLILQRSR